jgi:hypothetical protein
MRVHPDFRVHREARAGTNVCNFVWFGVHTFVVHRIKITLWFIALRSQGKQLKYQGYRFYVNTTESRF